MEKTIKALEKSPLFLDLPKEEILQCLALVNHIQLSYKKHESVALEGDACTRVGIVVEGHLEIQKIYPTGKAMTITHLHPGGMFGEIILFSGIHRYPATINAVKDTDVFFMEGDSLYRLLEKNPKIMKTFMRLLTRKILMLNARIKNLSYHSIREKVASFLIDAYQKHPSPYVNVHLTRQEMADLFNVPRPSLSREIIRMKKDGLIDFDKNIFKINDMKRLEDLLF